MTQPRAEKKSAGRAGDGIIARRTHRPCRRGSRMLIAARWLAAALLCASQVPASSAAPLSCGQLPAASAAARTGAVVAIGGALRYDNTAVWSRLVALAGGPGAPFVVLATAAENPARSAALAVAALEAHGAKAEYLPVAPRLAGVDLERAVRDPELLARVRAARGVFFTGGAQERIVDTLAPGRSSTPLLDAIRDLLARGGVVAGTSAGAAVLSGVMFRDATDVMAVMRGQLRDGKEIDCGLGFAPPGLFVDQHFLRRGRLGRMLPLMLSQELRLGLGVEEDSAAILRGRTVEVIGAGGALFVDLAGATSNPKLGAFNLAGARLTYLGDGDRLDLDSRSLTPAAARAQGSRVDPRAAGFVPYQEDSPFLLDVLADGAVLRGMTYALDGPAPEVRGLAFDARPDAAVPRDLGFEFRFSRTADTAGWFSSSRGGEDYSIESVRLDVVPVKVATPLYRAWSP
jgi:cyanophycinase